MNGKIVVCTSVTSGVGAKYTATNLAHYLKKNNNKRKVALVDFDFKNPYLGAVLSLDDTVHNIDNIIDKIDGNFLDDKLFQENMIKLKNDIFLLKGTCLLGKQKLFTEKHIKEIIKHLKNIYDITYIVINNEVENAGYIYSLFEADEVVIVSNNNFSCFKKIEKCINQINHYKSNSKEIKLIFNNHIETSQIDFSEIIKKYNINVLGSVKFNELTVDNIDLKTSGIALFKNRNNEKEELFNDLNNKLFEE